MLVVANVAKDDVELLGQVTLIVPAMLLDLWLITFNPMRVRREEPDISENGSEQTAGHRHRVCDSGCNHGDRRTRTHLCIGVALLGLREQNRNITEADTGDLKRSGTQATPCTHSSTVGDGKRG